MKKFCFLFVLAVGMICFQNKSSAQSLDQVRALKFSSTSQFTDIIESGSLSRLSEVNGFGNYTTLRSIIPDPGFPSDIDTTNIPEDDYDPVNDPSSFNDNDYKEHSVLSDILNEDKVVVIGNWMIKVDLEAEKSFVLNVNYASQYSDLVNENTENPNVMSFANENDGIEILNQLDQGESLERILLWCKDRYAKHKKDAKNFYRDNRHRLDSKVVYQADFIVHSLEAKGKCQKRFLRIWWHDGSGFAYMSHIGLDYEVRCRDKGFSHWGDPSGLAGYSSGSITSYRPYLSTRALKNYHYEVDFASTHGSGHLVIEDY